jgi:hypothetical protein
MNTIQIGKYKKTIPADWDELDRKSYLYVVNMFLTVGNQSKQQALFIYHFLKLKFIRTTVHGKTVSMAIAKKHMDDAMLTCSVDNKKPFDMTFVQGIQILSLSNFLFKEKSTLSKNHLDSISTSIFRKNLYGPSDDFQNLRLLEFSFCDSYYMRYRMSKEEENLDKMIAVLYRPAAAVKDLADKREKLNQHTIEDRAKQIKKLPLLEKQAILLWYTACRSRLERTYNYAFSKEKQHKAKSKNYGWAGLIVSMAGEKFGTVEQTSDEYIHTIFLQMDMQLQAQEQLENK